MSSRHETLHRPLLLICLMIAALLFSSGCSEDEVSSEDGPRWDTIDDEPNDPITLTSASRAFGYFPGDELTSSASALSEAFGTVVLRGQLLDELYFSRMGTTSADQSLFSVRIQALRAELEAQQAFGQYVIVLDLMRWSDGSQGNGPEPYLTVWDENDGRAINTYGFWRDEYRDAVLQEIERAVQQQKPAYFIVGAEMERLLGVPGGADDYANFITLYRQAYERIKSVSPDTKVSAGINWVRLQLDVAPTMLVPMEDLPKDLRDDSLSSVSCNALPAGDDAQQTRYKRACLDAAFASYVEPLLYYPNPNHDPTNALSPASILSSDFLALAASPENSDFSNDPTTCPEDFFGYLKSWSLTWPVLYYSTNWRVTSSVNEIKQSEWLETLVERNAGVNVSMVSWAQLRDMTTNDCGKLTTDIGAPDWVCYQGLWTVSNREKEVYKTITQ